MIEVFYIYKNKLGFWTNESKKFTNPVKASRFCWSMKNKPNMILDGYASYDKSYLDYMDRHVNEAVINGMAIPIKERRKKN